MNLALMFPFLLLGITNSDAQADSLKTKDFQIIIKFFDKGGEEVFEVPRVADSTNSGNFKNAYCIHIEEAEGGPYLIYTLHGNFEFDDIHSHKLCFTFGMNSTASLRSDFPIDENTIISSSLRDCNEDLQLPEYNYFLNGHLFDIFKETSRLLLIVDKKRGLSLELRTRD